MGASVLHEDAIYPVRASEIPINIRNTNAPEDPGTFITAEPTEEAKARTITGIAGSKDVVEFTKDYAAPAPIAIQDYDEGAIFRLGDTIYQATQDIEIPEFEIFDSDEDYAVGDFVAYNNRNYVVRTPIAAGTAIDTNSRRGNVTEFTANNLVVYQGENANSKVSNGKNYAKRTVVTKDNNYLMVSYIENTVIYVPPTSKENREEIEEFIDHLKY